LSRSCRRFARAAFRARRSIATASTTGGTRPAMAARTPAATPAVLPASPPSPAASSVANTPTAIVRESSPALTAPASHSRSPEPAADAINWPDGRRCAPAHQEQPVPTRSPSLAVLKTAAKNTVSCTDEASDQRLATYSARPDHRPRVVVVQPPRWEPGHRHMFTLSTAWPTGSG
jgi:hypothetical protein